MSLRFAIELFLYFVILIIFQYEISLFNQDLHLAIKELAEFDLLNKEIVKQGGTAYDPEDPHRLGSGEILDGDHEVVNHTEVLGVHEGFDHTLEVLPVEHSTEVLH